MEFIAKTLAGLEPVLVDELTALGATAVHPGKRAVYFEGDKQLMYKANLNLRTALRILFPIAEFKIRNEDDLYQQLLRIDWSRFMDVDQTLAVDAVTNSENLRHSKYAALKAKDAIVDQFRQRFGRRPSVDTINPHLRVNIHVGNDDVSVSLDSSGDSLHKRGYRVDSVEAPINEVLAAGMIMHAGWKGECDFVDPMCGSGTLAIEAALLASQIPPNMQRERFGFMRWKDFDRQFWEATIHEAEAGIYPLPTCKIMGFDQDFRAIRTSELNAEAAGLQGKITFERASFETLKAPSAAGVMMMNPPYDERLPLEDARTFHETLGNCLKHAWPGYTAWIISAYPDAAKTIGLRPSRKINLFNGKLECKLLKYEMYAGKKGQEHQAE